MVERCQISIYNVALSVSKINDLWTISACQKQKQKISQWHIANRRVLTTEERQNQVKGAQITDEAVLSEVGTQASGHESPRYSICSSLKHNVRIYLIRKTWFLSVNSLILWKFVDILYVICISG